MAVLRRIFRGGGTTRRDIPAAPAGLTTSTTASPGALAGSATLSDAGDVSSTRPSASANVLEQARRALALFWDFLGRLATGARRRPAILAAAALAAGIAFRDSAPLVPMSYLPAALGMLAVVMFTPSADASSARRTKRQPTPSRRTSPVWKACCEGLATIALAGAIFLIGLSAAQIEQYCFSSTDVLAYTGPEPRLAEIEARVLEAPRVLAHETAVGRLVPPRQVFSAEATALRQIGGWAAASGQMQITVEQVDPSLAAGQTVRLIGMLGRPEGPRNPGEFDWAEYCRRQRVTAELRVSRVDAIEVIRDPGPTPLMWLRQKTRRLLAIGFAESQSADHALLRALVLGDGDPRLREIQDDFEHTGVAYQLSVSGLHVAIIGALVLLLFRLLRASPRRAILAATATAALYCVVALPSEAGARSVLLFVAAGVGLIFGRSIDRANLLALCVMLILLIRPGDLSGGGFQISLAAVGAILLLGRRAEMASARIFRGDLFGSSASFGGLSTSNPWRRTRQVSAIGEGLRWIVGVGRRTIVLGAVAWAATLPLVGWHFQAVSPWGILASAVLLPVSVVALVGGVLKILLALALPGMSAIWADAASGPIALLRIGVTWLAKLPGANVSTAAPPPWAMAAYYGLMLAPLAPAGWLTWRPMRWAARAAPAAAIAMLAALAWTIAPAEPPAFAQPAATIPAAAIAGSPAVSSASFTGLPVIPVESRRDLTVTLLSVGAGQSAVVKAPAAAAFVDGIAGAGVGAPGPAATWLFDAGSSTRSDLMRETIAPYLAAVGRRRVDGLLLGGGDFGRVSAAEDVAGALGVGDVVIGPQFRRFADGVATDEHLLNVLDALGVSPQIMSRGDERSIGAATIRVLWPPANCAMNSNNCSLLVRLTYAGRRILFPADIQEPAEAALLSSPEELKADVLVAPRGGGDEILTRAFVAAVAPRIVVASSDRKLTRKQKTFDRLAAKYAFFRTGDYGAITVHVSARGCVWVTTFLNPAGGRASR